MTQLEGAFFWPQLLTALNAGNVIPVIGRDVLLVQDEGAQCTLDEYLARRVEKKLGLSGEGRAKSPTLHDVACRFLEKNGPDDVQNVQFAVQEVLAQEEIPVPDTLRKLARIDAFRIYVSTTFDDLLQSALCEERPGRSAPQKFAYSPNRTVDLPGDFAVSKSPIVYHLLGDTWGAPHFAVTEEDTLEFVHSLQSDNKRPKRLTDEFRSNWLLLIGVGYSDWLMRFFLRITKNKRLLEGQDKTDIVVDNRIHDDAQLGHFLAHFSRKTKVFPGGVVDFIDELESRWAAQRGEAAAMKPARDSVDPDEDAVFISYASEDRESALLLFEALRTRGVAVWLDREGGLAGGDEYKKKIAARIQNAAFFIPILSRAVLTPKWRFFKYEWSVAEDAKAFVGERTFIIPVRVDDIDPQSPGIPTVFRALHAMDAGNGARVEEVAAHVQRLYRDYQRALATA